jgi:hypothetical protein
VRVSKGYLLAGDSGAKELVLLVLGLEAAVTKLARGVDELELDILTRLHTTVSN